MSGDHPNNIVEIGQNTEKSPGDLRKLAVTQTLVRNHRLTSCQKLSKRVGSWRTGGDHPNDSIIENGQNTEKSPGDLKRLAVIQTPVKNHRLTLM